MIGSPSRRVSRVPSVRAWVRAALAVSLSAGGVPGRASGAQIQSVPLSWQDYSKQACGDDAEDRLNAQIEKTIKMQRPGMHDRVGAIAMLMARAKGFSIRDYVARYAPATDEGLRSFQVGLYQNSPYKITFCAQNKDYGTVQFLICTRTPRKAVTAPGELEFAALAVQVDPNGQERCNFALECEPQPKEQVGPFVSKTLEGIYKGEWRSGNDSEGKPGVDVGIGGAMGKLLYHVKKSVSSYPAQAPVPQEQLSRVCPEPAPSGARRQGPVSSVDPSAVAGTAQELSAGPGAPGGLPSGPRPLTLTREDMKNPDKWCGELGCSCRESGCRVYAFLGALDALDKNYAGQGQKGKPRIEFGYSRDGDSYFVEPLREYGDPDIERCVKGRALNEYGNNDQASRDIPLRRFIKEALSADEGLTVDDLIKRLKECGKRLEAEKKGKPRPE